MVDNDLPEWMHWFQVFATPSVAVIAAVVAGFIQYNQWRVSKDKLIIDLFDKRYEIYKIIFDSMCYVIKNADLTREEFAKFQMNYHKVKFLFGKDVQDFCDEINKKYAFIVTFSGHFGGSCDPNQQININQYHAYVREIYDEIERFDNLMRPYMSASKMRF